MDALAQPEKAEGPSQARPKRSRTGCLTCRTRRRKCDEGKPTCQNCTTKGFDCQYAAVFQILGKNNFTPEVKANVNYTNVRFVLEGEKAQVEGPVERRMSAEVQPDINPIINTSSPIRRPETGERYDQSAGISVPPDTSPSEDRYAFALHGLLALGTGNPALADVQTGPSTSDLIEETSPTTFFGDVNATVARVERLIDSPATVQHWQLADITDSPGHSEPSPDRALELLKHYRYHIAVWLDICDMDHCFGCEVLHLAKESASLKSGILAVAQASLSAIDRRRMSNLAHAKAISPECGRGHSFESSSVLDVLTVVQSAVTNTSRFWMHHGEASSRNRILERLLHDINNGSLHLSSFWVMVRLQLSYALMSPLPIRIPLPFASATSRRRDEATARVNMSEVAYEAVALCVDAVMFSQGDDDKWLQQRYGLNRVDVWGRLIQNGEKWYMCRPESFQAIIELYPVDGRRSEDEFPTIVFTGGAAILANQLFHTAMVLLLQSKPRFIGRTNPISPFMSMIWHAHRICAIAINNDREECWDPCMLASLLVVARMATHRSQHDILVRTVERVQNLTGWSISRHLDDLRSEWQ